MRRPSTSSMLTLGYLALGGLDTWLAGSSHPRAQQARMLTKPLLMPTLTASLLTDPRSQTSPLTATTVTAQVCGWAGDVLLLRHDTAAFAAGAGSFGVGHAAYITGFSRLRDRKQPVATSTMGKIAARLFVAGGPAMAVGAARTEKVLGPAVLGYTGLLSAMLAHAGNLDPALPVPARRRTRAGAALFTASDTLLGARKFWWRTAPTRSESVVMATYTLGQLLLSKGAAAAGG